MYTTSVCNAAIGTIAFEQQPVDNEFIEQWTVRALELFDADERTAGATWMPEKSEILVTFENIPDVDEGSEIADAVDEYCYNGQMGFIAIALECMDDAFSQLCNESRSSLLG